MYNEQKWYLDSIFSYYIYIENFFSFYTWIRLWASYVVVKIVDVNISI